MADYSNVSFKNNGKLKLLIIVGTRSERRSSGLQPSSIRPASILMSFWPTPVRTTTIT